MITYVVFVMLSASTYGNILIISNQYKLGHEGVVFVRINENGAKYGVLCNKTIDNNQLNEICQAANFDGYKDPGLQSVDHKYHFRYLYRSIHCTKWRNDSECAEWETCSHEYDLYIKCNCEVDTFYTSPVGCRLCNNADNIVNGIELKIYTYPFDKSRCFCEDSIMYEAGFDTIVQFNPYCRTCKDTSTSFRVNTGLQKCHCSNPDEGYHSTNRKCERKWCGDTSYDYIKPAVEHKLLYSDAVQDCVPCFKNAKRTAQGCSCPAGFGYLPAPNVCMECPNSTYTSDDGLCSSCPATLASFHGTCTCEYNQVFSGGKCAACGENDFPFLDLQICVNCYYRSKLHYEGDMCGCGLGAIKTPSGCALCFPNHYLKDGKICSPCGTSGVSWFGSAACSCGYKKSVTTNECKTDCPANIELDNDNIGCVCPGNSVWRQELFICEPCTFKTYKKNNQCIRCPAISLRIPAISPGSCVCPKGYYWDNSTCSVCERGTYSDVDGLVACKLCPKGTYSKYTYCVSCDSEHMLELSSGCNCDPGSVIVNGTCSQCGDGEYTKEAKKCVACPSEAVPSWSKDGCVCSDRVWNKTLNTCQRKHCLADTCTCPSYLELIRADCIACPPNSTTSSNGSKSICSFCVTNTTNITCRECPKGLVRIESLCLPDVSTPTAKRLHEFHIIDSYILTIEYLDSFVLGLVALLLIICLIVIAVIRRYFFICKRVNLVVVRTDNPGQKSKLLDVNESQRLRP